MTKGTINMRLLSQLNQVSLVKYPITIRQILTITQSVARNVPQIRVNTNPPKAAVTTFIINVVIQIIAPNSQIAANAIIIPKGIKPINTI
jgi:hypothetical protein